MMKTLQQLCCYMSGALGKRTKFQEKDSPQLVVLIQRDESITGISTGRVA